MSGNLPLSHFNQSGSPQALDKKAGAKPTKWYTKERFGYRALAIAATAGIVAGGTFDQYAQGENSTSPNQSQRSVSEKANIIQVPSAVSGEELAFSAICNGTTLRITRENGSGAQPDTQTIPSFEGCNPPNVQPDPGSLKEVVAAARANLNPSD
jgi:hypothetical protein